jgi:hypothetical protein
MRRFARAALMTVALAAAPAVALAQTSDANPGDAAAAGIFGAFASILGAIWCLFAAFMIALLVLWVIAIIDVASRNEAEFPSALQGRPTGNEKVMWVLVVILASWIGAAVYYFVVMRPFPIKSVRARISAEGQQASSSGAPGPAPAAVQPPAPPEPPAPPAP